jgi:hypothetical protein
MMLLQVERNQELCIIWYQQSFNDVKLLKYISVKIRIGLITKKS